MCYRCTICNAVVGPKVNLLRHIINRVVKAYSSVRGWFDRTEIEKELPVCRTCKNALDDGCTITQVKIALAPKQPTLAPTVKEPLALRPESVLS